MTFLRAAISILCLLAALAGPARAQVQGSGVGQTGTVTANDGACWASPGVIKDCGGAPVVAPVANGSLAAMPANTTKCNATGGSATPTDCTAGVVSANLCQPVRNVFVSGSAQTYTVPTCNSVRATNLTIKMVGGGGGGAGSGTTPGAATNGADTTWSGAPLTAGGGVAGGTSGSSAGGTATNCDMNLPGMAGGFATSVVSSFGGQGGVSAFGGAGVGGVPSANNGGAASTNTGSGGGGASNSVTANSGGGGGSGAYCEKLILTPTATYTYTVGAAGTGGTLGTGGAAGANGAAGLIDVTARWQ